MATVVTVTGNSRDEVERLSAELRQRLGLRPIGSGRPFEQPGRGGSWMTRLEVPEPTDADDRPQPWLGGQRGEATSAVPAP